jgi:tetratricopeptide (TPR) repeat protein
MSLYLDRSRIFVLIGALEEDLRRMIDLHLLANHYEEQIFGPAYSRAKERSDADPHRDRTETSLLHYLDLGDEIEILNRYRHLLPDSTSAAMAQHSLRLTDVIPIRNRVMHWRPLLPDDGSAVENTVRSLVREGFEGYYLRETLRRVEEQPWWSPAMPPPAVSVGPLNNLPLPDYDETGLIGRRRDVEKVKAELIRMGNGKRSPVLTITGPGGLGKTALALQALHDLVDSPECPYDLISWVSLKTERLSVAGVTEVIDAVRSLEEALPVLVETLDRTAGESIERLSAALDGINCLIAIDNLETVSGNEVIDLIDSLPDSVVYLFTSRAGLGQIERRQQIEPLDDTSAMNLLRATFKARGLSEFAAMSASTASEAVAGLGYSPLGIKWFVSGVEAGKDPEDILRNPDDLITFCVSNVFGALDPVAQSIASVLVVLARPLTVAEVRTFIPEATGDQLRSALQALLSRVLIKRSLVDGSLTEAFEATTTLTAFLQSSDRNEDSEVARIRDRDLEIRRETDRHRVEAAEDPVRPNVIQLADQHPGSVLLLRQALTLSRKREFDLSLQRVDEAQELDPEFWEIERVRGFILSSQGNIAAATAAYERAVSLAPDEWHRAVVQHFFAGHLLRLEIDSVRGEMVARESHRVLQTSKSAMTLGTALTRTGHFEEAREVLKEAIQASNLQTRMMAATQLVDCVKRHAESEVDVSRDVAAALKLLLEGILIADSELTAGRSDDRLVAKGQAAVSDYLLYLSRNPNLVDSGALSRVLDCAVRLTLHNPRGQVLDYMNSHLANLLVASHEDLSELQSMQRLRTLLESSSGPKVEMKSNPGGELEGVVKVWRPDLHYGFISCPEYPDGIYTHRYDLADSSEEIGLRQGVMVRFVVGVDREGRPRANAVRLAECHGVDQVGRLLEVQSIPAAGSYLFASDQVSGATVFVGRHAVPERETWDQLSPKSLLRSDVEIDVQGRFRAREGSVTVEAI